MKSISTDQYFLEDIFAEGWRVTKAIFAKCAPIVIAFGFIVNLGVQAAINRMGLAVVDATGKIPLRNQVAALLVGTFFYCTIFSVAILAIIKLAERTVTRRDISTAEALAEGFRRWPRIIWTGFIWAGSFLGLMCFSRVLSEIPPSPKLVDSLIFVIQIGIMLVSVLWVMYNLFVPYAIAVTSLFGTRALDYSASLVKRGRLRTACYFLVISLVAGAPAHILDRIGQSIIGGVGPHLPPSVRLPFNALVLSATLLPAVLQFSLGTVFFLNTAYLRRQA